MNLDIFVILCGPVVQNCQHIANLMFSRNWLNNIVQKWWFPWFSIFWVLLTVSWRFSTFFKILNFLRNEKNLVENIFFEKFFIFCFFFILANISLPPQTIVLCFRYYPSTFYIVFTVTKTDMQSESLYTEQVLTFYSHFGMQLFSAISCKILLVFLACSRGQRMVCKGVATCFAAQID